MLSEAEIEIIDGALDMSSKTVSEVMTPMDRVFGLSEDETLNRCARRAGAGEGGQVFRPRLLSWFSRATTPSPE